MLVYKEGWIVNSRQDFVEVAGGQNMVGPQSQGICSEPSKLISLE